MSGSDPGWSEQDLAALRRLKAEGLTAASIAGQLGRTAKAVYRQLDRLRREEPVTAALGAAEGPRRYCTVCREPIGQEWWSDWRRCTRHREARAA